MYDPIRLTVSIPVPPSPFPNPSSFQSPQVVSLSTMAEAARPASIDRMSIRSMTPTMRSVWSSVTHGQQTAPSELGIGITQALQQPAMRKPPPLPAVTQRRLNMEHRRPKWLRELLAEMIGVFFARNITCSHTYFCLCDVLTDIMKCTPAWPPHMPCF